MDKKKRGTKKRSAQNGELPLLMPAKRSTTSYGKNHKIVLNLSEGRSVRVTQNLVVLEDEVQNKYAVLNFQKLSKIVAAISEIDGAVEKLKSFEEVDFRLDIGSRWFVTVTTGFKCVDIRSWYSKIGVLKPTRMGMGLRLTEWETFKKQIKIVHGLRPDIAAVVPCYLQEDHVNPLGRLSFFFESL